MTGRRRNVLVAGTTGFIGRRVTAALNDAGHVVVDLPRDDIADCVAAEAGDPAARTRAGRFGDALAGEIDVMVWAAGRREADRAANDMIHATAPVACARWLGPSRVVYLSTGEVYGDAPLPYREDGPALGRSDYALAKLAGEVRLAADRPTTILRAPLVYGPDQAPRMLIPWVAAALRAGERFPLTHGRQTRDFLYVDDAAAAIVAAVERGPEGIINIGSGIEVTIAEVCRALARAFGADPALLGFGEVALRPDEAHRYVMDVAKAAELLAWRATTPLDEGLARLAAGTTSPPPPALWRVT